MIDINNLPIEVLLNILIHSPNDALVTIVGSRVNQNIRLAAQEVLLQRNPQLRLRLDFRCIYQHPQQPIPSALLVLGRIGEGKKNWMHFLSKLRKSEEIKRERYSVVSSIPRKVAPFFGDSNILSVLKIVNGILGNKNISDIYAKLNELAALGLVQESVDLVATLPAEKRNHALHKIVAAIPKNRRGKYLNICAKNACKECFQLYFSSQDFSFAFRKVANLDGVSFSQLLKTTYSILEYVFDPSLEDFQKMELGARESLPPKTYEIVMIDIMRKMIRKEASGLPKQLFPVEGLTNPRDDFQRVLHDTELSNAERAKIFVGHDPLRWNHICQRARHTLLKWDPNRAAVNYHNFFSIAKEISAEEWKRIVQEFYGFGHSLKSIIHGQMYRTQVFREYKMYPTFAPWDESLTPFTEALLSSGLSQNKVEILLSHPDFRFVKENIEQFGPKPEPSSPENVKPNQSEPPKKKQKID